MLPDDFDKSSRLLKLGENFGECEIFVFRANENSINIKKNSVDLIETHKSLEIGLRVFFDGKEGYSYANKFDDSIVKNAVSAAKISKEKKFYGLPQRENFRFESVDKRIFDFCAYNEISDEILEFIEIFDDKAILTEAEISFGFYESLILNSNGVVGEKKTSFFGIEGMCNYKENENENVSTSVDGRSERFFFDILDFGKKIRNDAVLSANPKSISEVPEIVIFNPETFSELLSVFASNFNAENVDKGNSILAGRIGQKVLNNIDIIDNPEMEKGIHSTPFDGEGVKTKKNVLMKDGVVNGFIYDYRNAKKFGVEPTGNAIRLGAGIPTIGFHNLVVESKNREKEIFSGVNKGIFVCSIIGTHTSDPTTTEFSVKIERGFLIENGEIKYPLKDLMISGKFIDMEIINLSGETENRGGIYTPYAVCKNVSII